MQNTNEESLLNEMREGRESANAAFVNFTDNYKNFTSHVFCFYEGEDGKYYNQRIKQLIGNPIIPIKAKNKSNTIKVWRKISKSQEYNNVQKMFFVDRDMDELPHDVDENLYITPCYSIENLYANIETFKNILEAEFSLNVTDPDFIKCVDLFEILFEKFCTQMIPFNALVLIRSEKKLNNGKVSLNIKTRQVISISLGGIEKGNKYSDIYKLQEDLEVTDQDLEFATQRIIESQEFIEKFRGKNQLDFLVEVLNLLKSRKDDLTFFSIKRDNITLNITSNRLSELSQYAKTPQCLKEFIIAHQI